MQTTSALYQSIIEGGGYWYETQLVIDGVGTYGETQLFRLNTNLEMLQTTPDVGKAVAGEIEVQMLMPDADIPVMAKLQPQVRVCNATQQSEWLSQGVFFIDTREVTHNTNGLDVLTLHGYDAMLKAEQMFVSDTITGDSVDTDMVDAIAAIMGVSVDSRTYAVMTEGYTIPLPTGYSCREVLGYIASMYCGCFIMSDTGELRLVSLLELPQETNYLADDEYVPISFGQEREEHQLSGQIVSFEGDGSPLVDLSTSFSPVQDLHGYANPWPAGGGTNILPFIGNNETKQGVTVSYDDTSQCYTLNGTFTSIGDFTLSLIPPSQLPISENLSGSKYYTLSVRVVSGSMTVASGTGITFAVALFNSNASSFIRGNTTGTTFDGYLGYKQSGTPSTGNYRLLLQCWRNGTVFDNLKFRVQIEIADNHVPTVWHPYSNICPIRGFDEAHVYVSPTEDAEDGTTYTIDLDGTRYSGTLNVTTGVLTVTHKFYQNAGTGNWGEVSRGGARYYIGGVSTDAVDSDTTGVSNIGALVNNFYGDGVCVSRNGRINLCGSLHNAFASIDALKTYLTQEPLQVVYELATPIEVQLTPAQVETLIGTNNVWSEMNGDTSLTYSYGGGECRIIV